MRFADVVPAGAVSGVSLMIQDQGRYLFALAPQGLWQKSAQRVLIPVAALGGRRHGDESYVQCAQNRALEAGVAVRLLASHDPATFVSADGSVMSLDLDEEPLPAMIMERVLPARSRKPSEPGQEEPVRAYVAVYRAELAKPLLAPVAPATAGGSPAALVWLAAHQVARMAGAALTRQGIPAAEAQVLAPPGFTLPEGAEFFLLGNPGSLLHPAQEAGSPAAAAAAERAAPGAAG